MTEKNKLARGILAVLQTPFYVTGQVDYESLERLVEDAIESGVDGFLVPAVASEVGYLTPEEREQIVRSVTTWSEQRVPVVLGASANQPQQCQKYAKLAEQVGAQAYLVAVPDQLYLEPERVVPFFQQVVSVSAVPLLIQDLQWNGPGLTLATIEQLRDALPTLIGLKIETIPAGPKYTAVRQNFGDDFFIAGGWAVPQWMEALDRGIDAMIPESAMIGVYAAILTHYRAGRREQALKLFYQLLPILSFSNQEIGVSIAFFKRLLVRRGIFTTATMRIPGFEWDEFNLKIADELIALYLKLERQVVPGPC